MRGLDGKTAIVAGGSTLIGQGVAETLAGYGRTSSLPSTIAVARRRSRGQKARRQGTLYPLRSRKRRRHCCFGEGDRRSDRPARFSRQCRLHLSRQRRRHSERADWLEAFDVNIVGSVMLMQAARPHLKKNKGAIVNFGSISHAWRRPARWVYPVSKAAILQLTRNQAMDLCARRYSRQRGLAGLDLEQHRRPVDQRQPRQEPTNVAKPFHLLGRTGNPGRSRGSGGVPPFRQRELHQPAPIFGASIGGYTAMGAGSYSLIRRYLC